MEHLEQVIPTFKITKNNSSMKRITLIALLFGLGAICAQAGNNNATEKASGNTYQITNEVLREVNFRNSLWMESGNTAGLAFRPFKMYKELELNYDHTSGQFRQAQAAGEINNVSLNTSGATYLGKFIIWGKFDFKNIFEKGRNMNALMYEVESDMPYYPIDTTRNCGWTKQEYELQAKLASPVLWDRVSFGVDVNYLNCVGSKHLDPRAETYKYEINIRPSAALRIGSHLIGISAVYLDSYERARPTNMNNWLNQAVYLHKGVGESIKGKVGDNDGIKTYLFDSSTIGAGLQYGYCGDIELLADLSFNTHKTDVVSSPSLPKKEGSTKRTEVNGNVEFLFGQHKSNKLWVDGNFRKTDGTEYVTKIQSVSSTEQYWQVLSQNVMSNYTHINASVGYDHLFGAASTKGYDWIVGGNVDFMMRNDAYSLPSSTFNATTAYANVFGGKQFKFKTSSLLVKIDGGYRMSLGSEYVFGGKNASYEPVNMYKAENAYYSTNYANGGASVAYTLNTNKIGYIFKASADYVKPLGADFHRLYTNASFGIVF